MLSQVPVKMNSLGLDKVVTAVKKYKTIKSTSNCPEKGIFVYLSMILQLL